MRHLCKRLPRDWLDRPPGRAATFNRIAGRTVAAMLLVALTYRVAMLTSGTVSGDSVETRPMANPVAGELIAAEAPTSPTVDLSRIADSHLFGEGGGATATDVAHGEAVPVVSGTTLDLRLTGTIAAAGKEGGGVAIIASGGVERTYVVADAIDSVAGARLREVRSNRVIVSRNGRLETLRFPEAYGTDDAAVARSAAVALPTALPVVSPEEPQLRASGGDGVLLQATDYADSNGIDEIVRVAGHVEQGRPVGLRVEPGRQAERFDELGFRPGDVVTQLNGADMSDGDVERGLRAFGRLGENSMANVTVIRDGVAQVLTIDTSTIGPREAVR